MQDILAARDCAREHDQVIARLLVDPAIYVDMSEEIERARDLGIRPRSFRAKAGAQQRRRWVARSSPHR